MLKAAGENHVENADCWKGLRGAARQSNYEDSRADAVLVCVARLPNVLYGAFRRINHCRRLGE